MTIIINATLAGGFSISTFSDLIILPAGAMWAGFAVDILYTFKIKKKSPLLYKNRLKKRL
jgi:hypothetical protein